MVQPYFFEVFISMSKRGQLVREITPTLIDRVVAGACMRPSVALEAMGDALISWRRAAVACQLALPGVLLEPLAWCQALLLHHKLRRLQVPDDPVVIVGHWRSGTTFLHQLLGADPAMATARNCFTVAPQVAVLLKPLLVPLLQRLMTPTRPIDAVAWGAMDPQEDEIGLARLTFETNMAGVAFPRHYLRHFRRRVLAWTPRFERQLLQFSKLTWLHDGAGKRRLLIKNSAHTARVPLLLKLFPRAKFVLLKRDPVDSVRSLVQVKQSLAELVALQEPLDEVTQVEETAAAHQLMMNAFEASRHLIPPGQLMEVDYTQLVAHPLETVERIYQHFDLSSWPQARAPIAQRAAAAAHYRARPVQLSDEAEARLQELMQPAGAGAVTGQTPLGRRH